MHHLRRLPAGPPRPVAFVDRDGVINERPAPHQYVTSWEGFRWVDGILPMLQGLSAMGFPLLVITNQQGVGKGILSEAALEVIHGEMTRTLQREGIALTGVLHCPHLEQDRCVCRKPRPGLIYRAMNEAPFLIDLPRSVVIGDADSDMQAGLAAGVGTRILVGGEGLGKAATHRVERVQDVLAVVSRLMTT
jgi:D-glycero-D-manno-heptose 1,7-bisphosphate phosphatase